MKSSIKIWLMLHVPMEPWKIKQGPFAWIRRWRQKKFLHWLMGITEHNFVTSSYNQEDKFYQQRPLTSKFVCAPPAKQCSRTI